MQVVVIYFACTCACTRANTETRDSRQIVVSARPPALHAQTYFFSMYPSCYQFPKSCYAILDARPLAAAGLLEVVPYGANRALASTSHERHALKD